MMETMFTSHVSSFGKTCKYAMLRAIHVLAYPGQRVGGTKHVPASRSDSKLTVAPSSNPLRALSLIKLNC